VLLCHVVSLTQTKKRPKERKESLVQNVRQAANEYKNIYVFQVKNMRNVYLQEVRRRWSDSRFFLGKNKVMTIALGRDPASEEHPNLFRLSRVCLHSNMVLNTMVVDGKLISLMIASQGCLWPVLHQLNSF
jgi:ribosomal protein L10